MRSVIKKGDRVKVRTGAGDKFGFVLAKRRGYEHIAVRFDKSTSKVTYLMPDELQKLN